MIIVTDTCNSYSIINDTWRMSDEIPGIPTATHPCDSYLIEGWYRFIYNGNNGLMATWAPYEIKCATPYPIWWIG